jgi:hypothetical protein
MELELNMDNEEINNEFTNVVLGDFGHQVEELIGGVVACDIGLNQAIVAEDHELIEHMMGHLGGLMQGITIGALPTVLHRFAHHINVERATVSYLTDAVNVLVPEVQAQVKVLADVVDARGFDALARINDAIQTFADTLAEQGSWADTERGESSVQS